LTQAACGMNGLRRFRGFGGWERGSHSQPNGLV
jgi:hypothetical protein